MADVEVVLCGGRVRADEVVVVVRVDLAREHVLSGVLVSSVADETLLVAVVHDGLSAGQVHQRMGEFVTLQQRLRVLLDVGQEFTDAAHVVIAQESRRGIHVGIGVGVVIVRREKVA
jgi:hypothetical protein